MLRALRFIGGGGGGFLDLDGGGGGGCFLPFAKPPFIEEELTFLGSLPCEVAGDADRPS